MILCLSQIPFFGCRAVSMRVLEVYLDFLVFYMPESVVSKFGDYDTSTCRFKISIVHPDIDTLSLGKEQDENTHTNTRGRWEDVWACRIVGQDLKQH